jgi:hypothetical protein
VPGNRERLARNACPSGVAQRLAATTSAVTVQQEVGYGCCGALLNSARFIPSAGIAAAFAAPALAPLLERNRGDDERGERVGPPPAGERVRTKAK